MAKGSQGKNNHFMHRKLFATFILSAALFSIASAQAQSHKIRVKVNGISDTTVYLANYYGEKLFYNDTTRADANGYFEFKGKPAEEGGKYAVVVPGPKFFEIIVTEEPIYIETDNSDLLANLKVIESKENTLFVDYMRFIQSKRTDREPWDRIMADSSLDEKSKAKAKIELERLNQDVLDHQAKIVVENRETLFAKLLLLTIEPEIPSAPEGIENEQLWRYYYYRDHYWDNVDLSDGRLVRDQMFHRVLDKYWTKILPQVPDTLIREAQKLIERTDDYDMFKYITHHITFSAEKSNLMCMDKVFVSLVNKYYRTGKVDWLNEEQLSKIIDRANDLKYVQCGEAVPNIILPDTSGDNWVSLYDIDAKYTVIVIWEASCGHCKKEMPKLKKLYQEWKPKGLEIYAIGNDFETEPWLKFIKDKNIGEWINVSDNPAINKSDSATKLIYANVTTLPSLNFRSTFDVFSTPKMFLLDADKRIIAKQLGAEQLEELLQRMEGGENPETGQTNSAKGAKSQAINDRKKKSAKN